MVTGFHARLNEPWLDQAACIGADTKLFFPGRGSTPKIAKEICGGCPVRVECLEYAIRKNVQGGVLGGESVHAPIQMEVQQPRPLLLSQCGEWCSDH